MKSLTRWLIEQCVCAPHTDIYEGLLKLEGGWMFEDGAAR